MPTSPFRMQMPIRINGHGYVLPSVPALCPSHPADAARCLKAPLTTAPYSNITPRDFYMAQGFEAHFLKRPRTHPACACTQRSKPALSVTRRSTASNPFDFMNMISLQGKTNLFEQVPLITPRPVYTSPSSRPPRKSYPLRSRVGSA